MNVLDIPVMPAGYVVEYFGEDPGGAAVGRHEYLGRVLVRPDAHNLPGK